MPSLRLIAFTLLLATPALAQQQNVPVVVREQTAGTFQSGQAVTLAALLLFALIFGGSKSGSGTGN